MSYCHWGYLKNSVMIFKEFLVFMTFHIQEGKFIVTAKHETLAQYIGSYKMCVIFQLLFKLLCCLYQFVRDAVTFQVPKYSFLVIGDIETPSFSPSMSASKVKNHANCFYWFSNYIPNEKLALKFWTRVQNWAQNLGKCFGMRLKK